MPNWCSNSIKITGENDNLSKFAQIIESIIGTDQLLFATLLPEIQKPEIDLEDFNTNIFGTKWDLKGTDDLNFTRMETGEYYLCCETAWSPPFGFCQLLAKKYNLAVYIQYGEEGGDFYGNAAFDQSGNEMFNNEYPYKEGIFRIDPAAFWDNCQYYIEDFHDNDLSLSEILTELDFLPETEHNRIAEIYQEVTENN